MNKETYKKMTGFLHSHPTQAENRHYPPIKSSPTQSILPTRVFFCGSYFTTEQQHCEGRIDPLLSKAILVPAVSFIAVSLLRALINAPRPYEAFALPPVIAKDTKGKSFPSRHAFSIFVIGVTFLAACPLPLVGWLILALGVCLAVVRVLAGVHFPRDVAAGALLGIACGCLGFWIV